MAAVIKTEASYCDNISKLKGSLETFKVNLNIQQQNLEKIEHSIQALTQEIAQITAEDNPERAGDLTARNKILKETLEQRSELQTKIKQLNEEIHSTQLSILKNQFDADITNLWDPSNAYRKQFEESGKTVHEFLFETQSLRIRRDNSHESFLAIIDDYTRLGRHEIVALWRKLTLPFEYENVFKTVLKIFNDTQDPAYGLLLSTCYEYGFGTKRDRKKGLMIDQNLMEKGSILAQCSIANEYHQGKLLPEDVKKCHELYVSATASTQTEFYTPHFTWGQALLEGELDTEINITAGLELLHTAATKNQSLAAIALAAYYMQLTVEEMPNRGEKTFFYAKLAADLDSPFGIFFLAKCYAEGLGTSVDYPKYHALMQRSADLGCSDALGQLAFDYATGIEDFLDVDPKRSIALLFQALRQEGAAVPALLENYKPLFLRYQQDIEFMNAAYAGCYQCFQGHALYNPQDSFIIGTFFQSGFLIPQDIEEAIACFKDATQYGHAGAANVLASLLCIPQESSSEACTLPSLSPSDIYQLEGLVDEYDAAKVIKQTKRSLTPLWKMLCDQWKSHTGESMPTTLCRLVADYAYEAPKAEKPKV